jgi:hypothetical protein
VVDGKNMDMVQIWKHEHLHWGPRMSSNFEIVYGLLNIFSGNYITPFLLKRLTPRQFTTVTNVTNGIGFFMRGAADRGWVFLAAAIPMMPGNPIAFLCAWCPHAFAGQEACSSSASSVDTSLSTSLWPQDVCAVLAF